MSEQQKLFASLSGAIVVHLIFLLFVFAFLNIRSANSSSGSRGVDPEAQPKTREVTVLMSDFMEQVTVEPVSAGARSFVATDLNTPEAAAPANALYESDRNTSAASALRPDLSKPLQDGPTLKGNSRLPNLTLANRHFRDGDPAAVPAAPASAAAARGLKTGEREAKTVEPSELLSRSGEVLLRPLTDDAEEEVMSDGAEEKRILDPENFQPEERQNVTNGLLTKAGRDAVDAEATPLGIYKKAVRDVISANWHRYRRDHADAVTWGILKLKFRVDRDGHVNDLQITKNEANATLIEFSLKAIREAKLPPMPPAVVESVGSRGLVIRYDIITY